MKPEKALAKLAGKSGFKGQRIDSGVPELTIHDISAALAGMDRQSYCLSRALWVEDYSVLSELLIYVHDYTLNLSIRDDWKVPKDNGFIRNMAIMAIDEVVFAHANRCLMCTNGMIHRKTGEDVLCKYCGGHGFGRISTRDRAKRLDIDESNMRRNWGKKYELIHDYVLDLKLVAWRHIKVGLQSPH